MNHNNHFRELSLQHHHELQACSLLKKGIRKKADLAVMQDFTRQFWNEALKDHVTDEENILIPFLLRDHRLREYAIVLRNDHELIERIFDRSQDGLLSYRMLELFADNVEQHIHFKEKVVFTAIEELMPGQEMTKLHRVNKPAKDYSTYRTRFWD